VAKVNKVEESYGAAWRKPCRVRRFNCASGCSDAHSVFLVRENPHYIHIDFTNDGTGIDNIRIFLLEDVGELPGVSTVMSHIGRTDIATVGIGAVYEGNRNDSIHLVLELWNIVDWETALAAVRWSNGFLRPSLTSVVRYPYSLPSGWPVVQPSLGV
jgi:hypothetical protein